VSAEERVTAAIVSQYSADEAEAYLAALGLDR
jgi:hypothetical protein